MLINASLEQGIFPEELKIYISLGFASNTPLTMPSLG